jgi:gas vesicle protein
MTEGRYKASDHGSHVGTAIAFLLIGLGAGALLGALYAPKAGKQMRKELGKRYKDARESIDDWAGDAKDIADEVIERGTEFVEELRERIEPIAKNVRKSF